jgi:hypothetical protein
MNDPKITKERMLQGFQPVGHEAATDYAMRSARALEYIALYMERIDKRLGLPVGDPDEPKPVRPAVDLIATSLNHLQNINQTLAAIANWISTRR